MSFLEVSAISHTRDGALAANKVTFQQHQLQKIAIAGETGSGKSTVLRMIAGLVQPSAGEIRFMGERVEGPYEKLIPGHPGIAYLSQEFELPKFLRVEQILQYASKMENSEAATLYDICRISHLMKRKTNELSGGEQQRIALARLLVGLPKLLLLDEPFSNLDAIHKGILKKVIHDVQERLLVTCMLISHDPLDTLSWADEILVLKSGEMVQQGSPQHIYQHPANEYVAGMFGKYNILYPALLNQFYGAKKPFDEGGIVIARPESILVNATGGQAIYGHVKTKRFMGSYYEVDLVVAEQLITARADRGQYRPGDLARISLVKNAVVQVADISPAL